MTRFARAKGSKASNLKSPEDSTPWEVMKEQLLKSKKENDEIKNREEAEKQRIENYNNFLKEQKTQKRKATWCEFPEAQNNTIQKKSKKLNNQESAVCSSQENLQNDGNTSGVDQKMNQNPKKKNKKKKSNKTAENYDSIEHETINEDYNAQEAKASVEQNEDVADQTPSPKKNKKKKNKKIKQSLQVNGDGDAETNTSIKNSEKEVNNTEHHSPKPETKKKKKKNKKQKSIEGNITTSTDNKACVDVKRIQSNENNPNQSSPSKKRKDKNSRKKPIDDKSFKLIINSKEVQLVRYDGFPIVKKDAERLMELKKSMIQKGIPKSEVQRTMKLERRRAEKALARLKRDVCYNCRKGGHNLSDCPDLKNNIAGAGAEGVCFKCGSTEHRQFECKVQRDKEFRFATCFICKEAGHIARQCPDNPKGLYPNGGCCKLCGDVTHLRKDCPTVKEQKEGTSIKLQTLNDDNIEDIGQSVKPVPEEPVAKKPKKIKF